MLLTDIVDFLQKLWPFLAILVQALCFMALLWLKNSFVLRVTFETSIATINTRLTEMEREQERVIGRLEQLPTSDDITQINLSLCEVQGKLDAQQTQLSATNDNLRRLENQLTLLYTHLLSGGQ